MLKCRLAKDITLRANVNGLSGFHRKITGYYWGRK